VNRKGRAGLEDAIGGDFFFDAEFAQDRNERGHGGFSDQRRLRPTARKEPDPDAPLGEKRSHRRTRRAAANHRYALNPNGHN